VHWLCTSCALAVQNREILPLGRQVGLSWTGFLFVSIDIRTFLLLEIRSCSRLVRLVAGCSLIRPSLPTPPLDPYLRKACWVEIRPRRRIFTVCCLLTMYSITVGDQNPLQGPSWQACASCVSTTSSPLSTPPSQLPRQRRQRLAGWLHMVCPLAMDHTHILPGKKRQSGSVRSLHVSGLWEGGGGGRAPVRRAPQPVSARQCPLEER
jgi:hypothetical protein